MPYRLKGSDAGIHRAPIAEIRSASGAGLVPPLRRITISSSSEADVTPISHPAATNFWGRSDLSLLRLARGRSAEWLGVVTRRPGTARLGVDWVDPDGAWRRALTLGRSRTTALERVLWFRAVRRP